MSRAEESIIAEVKRVGKVESLFKLSIELELNPETVRNAVRRLEGNGLLTTEYGRNRATVIRPTDKLGQWASAEGRLLTAIRMRGEVRNLTELAQELDINYKRALRYVYSFQRAGLVDVYRECCRSPRLVILAKG